MPKLHARLAGWTLALGLVLPAAQAAPVHLLGDTVTSTLPTQFAGQNWDGSNQAVVGTGVEFRRDFNGGSEFMELDVTDNGFIFRFTNNYPGAANNPQGFFNLGLTGLTLSDLDPAGGVALGNLVLVSSTWPGNVFASQTQGADSVAFDFTGRNTVIPGKGTVWEAQFQFQGSTPSVPEPSTAWLGALSMGLLAAVSRRRRSA